MKNNVAFIAEPIVRRLIKVFSYVQLTTADGRSMTLVEYAFPAAALADFQCEWCNQAQVKRLERITAQRRKAQQCKHELKQLDRQRKDEIAAGTAQINEEFKLLQLQAIRAAGFKSEAK